MFSQTNNQLSALKIIVEKMGCTVGDIAKGHHFILGYTDEHCYAGFRQPPLKTVMYWASRTIKRFKSEGYTVLRSSLNDYYVVFDHNARA